MDLPSKIGLNFSTSTSGVVVHLTPTEDTDQSCHQGIKRILKSETHNDPIHSDNQGHSILIVSEGDNQCAEESDSEDDMLFYVDDEDFFRKLMILAKKEGIQDEPN